MPSTTSIGSAAVTSSDALHTRLTAIAEPFLSQEGPLLPILQAIQEAFGYIPEATAGVLASQLNLGKAEVHGVISFYHDFRSRPVSGTLVRICRAEACQAMGGDALARAVQQNLGAGWHHATADGRVALEPVYCLGLCACAPAAEVGGQLVGRATAGRIQQILEGGE